jgi:uncharacterized protein
MQPFIAQNTFSHIKKLTLISFLLLSASCNDKKRQSTVRRSDPFSLVRNIKLALPSGKMIDTKLAITNREQTIGLSGKKLAQMTKTEGLLFFYLNDGRRQFWMPNTYFDIHIIFLDKDLKVVGLERNVPHHPGKQEPPKIYRTKAYLARHVLEIRADSPLGEEIAIDTKFAWYSKTSLLETESHIHRWR